MKKLVEYLAEYNQWMNSSLFGRCALLTEQDLRADRGAFFQSVWGTLNHLAVADTLWLKRLNQAFPEWSALSPMHNRPLPQTLDTFLYSSFDELASERSVLDQCFINMASEMVDEDFVRPFSFRTINGISLTKNLDAVLLHIFNHQTHHRGQVTTLLSQMGIDFGPTDLLLRVPNLEF